MTDYLNNSNKTSLLFKRFQNKIQTGIDVTTNGTGGTSFFNEQQKSLNNIYNTDIFIENIEKNLPDEYKLSSLDACGNIHGSVWNTNISDQDYSNSSFLIPNTNLKFYKEIYLNPVSGTNNAWWLIPPDSSNQIIDNNLLKDMIPFNFNTISLSTFSPIVKYWDVSESGWRRQSQNNTDGLNWLIDYASGILQFYQNDLILGNLNIDCNSSDEKKRPRISFIKYVGRKGLDNLIDTLNELGDVTLTSVTTGDLLRYNGSNFVNTKIALDNNFTNVNFTSLTNGDLIKYDGSNFINFAPNQTDTTYSNGTGVNLVGTTFSIGQPVATSDAVTFKSLNILKDYFGTPIDPIINFTDNQNGGTLAHIQMLGDGVGAGQLQFFTKRIGGTLQESLTIKQYGGLVIKTDAVGLQINSQDGITEQGYIYNSNVSATKDLTIDAAVGSTTKGILFRTNSGQDRMRIGYDGRVGINTLTPGGLLEVRNSGSQYLLYGPTGNLSTFDPEGTGVEVRLGGAYNRPGVYSSGALELHSDTTGIIFGDSNVEKMRMNATGAITLQSDSGDCRFRNARIGNLYSNNYASFSAANFFSEGNYAFLQQNNAVGETFVNAPTGASVHIRNNNNDKMIINATGVGIGSAPVASFALYINGICGATGGFNGGPGGATWIGTTSVGNISPIFNANYQYNIGTSGAQYLIGYAFSWSSSSDDRLKDNETDISGALEIIMKLKPQTYDFKSSEEPDAKHLGLRSGFIAQDVLEIPELAHAVNVPENETERVEKELDEDGNIVDSDKETPTYMSLDYNTIFTHAVKAIQELNEKVKLLENEINILKNSSG